MPWDKKITDLELTKTGHNDIINENKVVISSVL